MLNRFAFRRKMYYLCVAKRREPIDKGFSPLFSCENAQKNHCFTKHIEKFICRSGFSNGFCGFFSGQVGARIGDIEFRKVKRYLFSTLHFFAFLRHYSSGLLLARGAQTASFPPQLAELSRQKCNLLFATMCLTNLRPYQLSLVAQMLCDGDRCELFLCFHVP